MDPSVIRRIRRLFRAVRESCLPRTVPLGGALGVRLGGRREDALFPKVPDGAKQRSQVFVARLEQRVRREGTGLDVAAF